MLALMLRDAERSRKINTPRQIIADPLLRMNCSPSIRRYQYSPIESVYVRPGNALSRLTIWRDRQGLREYLFKLSQANICFLTPRSILQATRILGQQKFEIYLYAV